MSENLVYVGKDLEAMSFAENYHRWILDEFRPFLGKRLVEVGAGTGLFTELLLNERPESLTAVEPSAMFDSLQANMAGVLHNTQLTLHRAIFADVCGEIRKTERPDSIIYVNVLEHIEDDIKELELIYDTLPDGGRCFIFVPALMSLYGAFDRAIGHFRRYAKREIEDKCSQVGLRLLRSHYFDLLGVVPWYVKYRLIGSDSLEPGAVAVYDRFAVPAVRILERIIRPPIGKNLLLVCEK